MFRLIVLGLLLILIASCRQKPPLLNLLVDTVPEPDVLHIAQLALQQDDARQIDLAKCFTYEPSVEFYDTKDTHRLFAARNISADNMIARNDLSYFKTLRDINILLLTFPKENGVAVRSFRFKQARVVEGFVAQGELKCESIYNWLNLVKIISYPDNGYIFDGKVYLGRSPRWVELIPGKHLIQVETLDEVIGREELQLPGTIQVIIKKKE